nr:immunoglobulin light chain junction region [Macaca mulatta]MOX85424.1 immunoglobulin light chain junction region [Macaca mulatta]MOX86013.1 immunoglobulin light chain junction region [Macaca mulatta]MOX86230.1 immunoglobulin light chain junction region [Macaca mulatta]MOX86308.1 immunoglobulin light chain junction region [Macaca mulatta]
CQQGDNIPYSF